MSSTTKAAVLLHQMHRNNANAAARSRVKNAAGAKPASGTFAAHVERAAETSETKPAAASEASKSELPSSS